jgi:hypothetical protein
MARFTGQSPQSRRTQKVLPRLAGVYTGGGEDRGTQQRRIGIQG